MEAMEQQMRHKEAEIQQAMEEDRQAREERKRRIFEEASKRRERRAAVSEITVHTISICTYDMHMINILTLRTSGALNTA
jgi:hypothetical protein